MMKKKRLGWTLIGLGVFFGVAFQALFGNFAYLVGGIGLIAGSIIVYDANRNQTNTIAEKPESSNK